jgi:hypothetical protein
MGRIFGLAFHFFSSTARNYNESTQSSFFLSPDFHERILYRRLLYQFQLGRADILFHEKVFLVCNRDDDLFSHRTFITSSF